MTTRYSDLLSEVLPVLSADPSDPVTEAAIRRAVTDLCFQSWIWKHYPDPIDVVAGTDQYELEPPYLGNTITIVEARLSGDVLVPANVSLLMRENPRWRSETGTPKRFIQTDTKNIVLQPVPDSSITGGLQVTLAITPSRNSDSFPQWIADRYLYTIIDGALSYLMMMQNKPWTNLQMGVDCRARFAAGIANARASAITSMDAAPLRTTPIH